MAESAAVGRGISPYKRLRIYSTRARLLVVGYDETVGRCRVLRLNRQDAQQLDAAEDADTYTPEEANALLMQMQEATAQHGGLQLVCEGHGIIGCFRFTDSYYLLVITRREYVGHICGHKVYKVAETAIIPLSAAMQRLDNSSADSTAEKRYRKLLAAVDLTKDFYFSYSYSLAHTLQRNHTGAAAAPAEPSATPAMPAAPTKAATAAASAVPSRAAAPPSPAAAAAAAPPAAAAASAASPRSSQPSTRAPSTSGSQPDIFDSMFVWNAFLTRALRAAAGSSRWAVPLVHGFWEQRAMSVFGRPLTITLLARRSRHFAGTRFRKRGINDEGKVANEVETEQIVDAGVDWATGQPLWSSVVQLRGSIPLYWSQQASTLSPKPDIVLQQFDPLYRVTQRHFDDLRSRYGNPVVTLNLLKARERRPREALLRKEFAAAISMLNDAVADPGRKIAYIPWDFQQWAKQPGANILLEISSVMRLSLDLTGIYVHNPAFCDSCAPSVHHRRTQFAQRLADNASARPQRRTRPVSKQQHQQQHQNQQHHHQEQQRQQQQHASHHADGDARALPPHSPTTSAAATTLSSAPATAHTASSSASSHAAAGVPLPLPPPKSARPTAPRTQLQHGVLRTNCIDCLDRTNVAQFAFGLMALGRQLHELGLLEGSDIDSDSSAALHLMEMYELMGHELALQYGGSEAHSVFFQRRRGEWEAATQSRDLLTSIRRFYSNTYTDSEKQDAINLFLGNYVPGSGKPALWELDSDYYLHSGPWALYGELMAARQLQAVSPVSTSRQPSPFQRDPGTANSTPRARLANSTNGSSSDTAHTSTSSSHAAITASSSASQAGKDSPFASSGAQAAASAAMVPGAFLGREGNPLLPLTHSDGVTIDAPDSSPGSAEAGWDFRLVFQLRAAQTGPLQLFPDSSPACQLLSLDRILAKQPRVRNVRLYPSASARSNVMWDAVQQAFTFFATGTDGAVGDMRISDSDWQAASPPGSPSTWRTDATTPAAIKPHTGAAATPHTAVPSTSAPAQLSTTQAALGPAPAAAAGTAATGLMPSMPDQLLSALGSMRPGARAPAPSPIPVLNDFLEIRTDIAPVRRITKAPEPSYGASANRWLDSALEQLAWASLPRSRSGGQPPISALNDIIEIRPAAAAGTAPAASADGVTTSGRTAADVSVRSGRANGSVQPSGIGGSAATAAGGDVSVSSRRSAAQRSPHQRADVGMDAQAEQTAASSVSVAGPLWPGDEEADWVFIPGSSGVSGSKGMPQHAQPGQSQEVHLSQPGRVVSSGDMAEPSLTSWLQVDAHSMGLAPEVAAVWLGGEEMSAAWAAAHERVSVGYKRYVLSANTWRLLEPHGCAVLQRWYDDCIHGQQAGGYAAMATAP